MKYLLALVVVLVFYSEAKAVTFAELPFELQIVSVCESGARHFLEDGSVIKSKTRDVGLFQINHIHFEKAAGLGYNVFTPEGNINYAYWLYQKNGLRDWLASKSCWNKNDYS